MPSKSVRSALAAALGLAVVLILATPAWAARQRTFVASFGVDPPANMSDCALATPCRTFNEAIKAALPGGEVVILDTAGYGAMTIDRAIKVVGPSGVYGAITVFGGAAPTTGIVINAGDTDVVTLRGLDILGLPPVPPQVPPFPQYGIDIQNAGTVHIEKTSINNFTQDTSACINAVSPKPVQIFVNDSFLRECRNGIFINGTGPDDTTRLNLVVDNTRIEHMINTGGVGTVAVNLNNLVIASIRNTILAWGGDGIRANNTNTVGGNRVFVIGSQITRFGNAAIETLGAPNASVHVNVSTSVFNNSNAAILHGHGLVNLTTNLISHHNFSIVDCGGGAASVTSLGYGGAGSNSVSNNLDVGPPWPGTCPGPIIVPTKLSGI